MGSGGDRQFIQGSESTAAMLNALERGLPGLTQAINEQILPSEQAQLAATQQIAPQIAQLQTDLYTQFGPALAEAAVGIEDASRRATAASEAGILADLGPELAQAALDIQGIIDPEFIASRARISDQMAALNMSPELSGAELAQLERYQRMADQNRGLAGGPASGTRAAESAINFGDALFNKKLQLSNALTGQSQALPAMRIGFDPVQATLGRPSIAPGVAGQQLPGVQQQAIGDQASQFGLNLLSEAGANQRAYTNQQAQGELAKKDIFDKVLSATQSFGNVVGSFTGSDRRLKDAIAITSAGAKLKDRVGFGIYTWVWNQEARKFGKIPGSMDVGVIAQEVLSVFPDCVTDIGDGYLGVDYGKLLHNLANSLI